LDKLRFLKGVKQLVVQKWLVYLDLFVVIELVYKEHLLHRLLLQLEIVFHEALRRERLVYVSTEGQELSIPFFGVYVNAGTLWPKLCCLLNVFFAVSWRHNLQSSNVLRELIVEVAPKLEISQRLTI
jgi:hypothetical protein